MLGGVRLAYFLTGNTCKDLCRGEVCMGWCGDDVVGWGVIRRGGRMIGELEPELWGIIQVIMYNGDKKKIPIYVMG